MDPVQQLIDKDRVIDTINRLFIATDQRDCAGVRATLAEMVVQVRGEEASATPSWSEGSS